MERRKFIRVTGVSALSAFIAPSITSCGNKNTAKTFSGHTFEDLPYSFSELEPNIDTKTMELHYNKHHKGYYNKFTAAIKGSPLINTPMPTIFKSINKYDESIRNNGGGYYNHSLFWKNLSSNGGKPSNNLLKAINASFGSLDNFKLAFYKEAKTQFGSGWAWLIMDNTNNLIVCNTANQNNPLMQDEHLQGIPLIAFDVWEHAYYLKYQNKRSEYINAFWNIVNWNEVNKRYEGALSGKWMG